MKEVQVGVGHIPLGPDNPHPVAKIAAVLANGGTIRYEVLEGSDMDDCWIGENILPETSKLYCDKKAVVTLSKALLWACFNAETQDIFSIQKIKRVHTAYEAIWMLESTLNPVCKVPLEVCGYESYIIIEELFDKEASIVEVPVHEDISSPTTPEVPDRTQSRHLSEMQAVLVRLMLIPKQNEELTTEMQTL